MRPAVLGFLNLGLALVFVAISAIYFNLGKPMVAWIYVATAILWAAGAVVWFFCVGRGRRP